MLQSCDHLSLVYYMYSVINYEDLSISYKETLCRTEKTFSALIIYLYF